MPRLTGSRAYLHSAAALAGDAANKGMATRPKGRACARWSSLVTKSDKAPASWSVFSPLLPTPRCAERHGQVSADIMGFLNSQRSGQGGPEAAGAPAGQAHGEQYDEQYASAPGFFGGAFPVAGRQWLPAAVGARDTRFTVVLPPEEEPSGPPSQRE